MSIINEGSNNRISNNIFKYNKLGHYSYEEIWSQSGGGLIIINNTFISQDPERECLQIDNSNDCIIKNNEFNGYDTAIIGLAPRNNIISHNNFINNGWGIDIGFAVSNKIIYNNFIINDLDVYILISFNNKIHDNYWDEWIGLKF